MSNSQLVGAIVLIVWGMWFVASWHFQRTESRLAEIEDLLRDIRGRLGEGNECLRSIQRHLLD